jgi:hypothetical protein
MVGMLVVVWGGWLGVRYIPDEPHIFARREGAWIDPAAVF